MQQAEAGEGPVQEARSRLATEVVPRTAKQDPYYIKGPSRCISPNANWAGLVGGGDAGEPEWPGSPGRCAGHPARHGKAALPSGARRGLSGCQAAWTGAHRHHTHCVAVRPLRPSAAVMGAVEDGRFPPLPSRHLSIVRRDDPGGRLGGTQQGCYSLHPSREVPAWPLPRSSGTVRRCA